MHVELTLQASVDGVIMPMHFRTQNRELTLQLGS